MAQQIPSINRVMVATDRSQTADQAVRWAANLAAASQAELLLLQVIVPSEGDGVAPEVLGQTDAELRRFASELAEPRGRAKVVVGDDPAQAIIDAVEREGIDVIVVGNLGMGGRKKFLLGNVPNRVSHNAHCTVIIVNTSLHDEHTYAMSQERATEAAGPVEGEMLRRAWRIGRVLARAGARELLARGNQDAPM